MIGLMRGRAKVYKLAFLFSRILNCGIWPALPLTGYWLMPSDLLQAPDSPFPLVTLFSLWTMSGIVVWSGGLLSAAAARVYRGDYFGLAGWAVVIVSLIALVRS